MRGLVVAFVSVLLLAPRAASAQTVPQLTVQVDQDTVGVGDVVTLEMTAQSGDAMPSDPRPGATPGFVVRGQNASPTQTHIAINGVRIDRFGLTVDWALQAQRVGTFAVGPASVVVGGVRYAARAPLTLHVVPAGQAPHRAPPQAQPQQGFDPFGAFSPFDAWKGLIQGFQGQQQDDQQPPAPSITTDPKLALAAPRGAYYFLHATVDKTSVVVGEQVTFSVYEYIDAGAMSIQVDDEDVHDATAADFVKHPLLRDDQDALLSGYAQIAGRTWIVKLVRRWALFPLRAGDLTIGPMSVSLLRPRTQMGAKRATETLRVHVTEPPVAGRPPGYALGDVGHFALTAQVSPNAVDQGGAVGVHVELSGTGNVPSAITTPAREGVEWLAPEVHDNLGAIGHDTYGGKRTFDYVVRLERAGDVDLGELAVPFWDPEQKRYDVARATLGAVHVAPSGAAPTASADPVEETLPGLPPPRDALEGMRAPRAHPDDSLVFWLLGVGAWPMAFGLAVGGRAAGRRVAGAWRSRKTSPAAELRERVAAAEAACQGNDPRAADAAVMRALEAASVAHAGVSVRGAIGDEVVDRLAGAGVARDAAMRLAELLRECEAARFAPDAADVVAARDRWIRAQGVLRQLAKGG